MAARLELGALRYAVQRFTLLAVFAVLLFYFADRWDWPRGWAFLAAVAVVEALTLAVLAWRAPTMLNQRGKAHGKMAWFDWLFAPLWLIFSFATPVVVGLEVKAGVTELAWSAFWAGAGVMGAAAILGTWAMLENEHFEQFVRIQVERNHRVVDSGPYRLVRHPGYLAAIVGALTGPLMMGVLYAYIPAGLIALLFVWRTALEDRSLRRDLPGYADYAKRTRWRLVPGLW
jgi:protein-S-isoprenylcysteine O-methyltransferase Ste14